MQNISLIDRLRRLIHMGHDKALETETAAAIESGVEFSGAKLWILVLAIFVASLGLNTNSTAVIIGAMLISPLMGPIIGMGFGVGVYDFQLLKRAFRNYLIATLFSVATATVYFLLSPIQEAQSELLARTSPTIYDVAIALCGGLAGIIGLSSKSQRTGNVIPGVAIATALMPPLCTVGFGLATANWLFAAGAFYLYLINTIFIALSTFIGVNCMGFHKQTQIDQTHQKKVRNIIYVIVVLTIVPSIFMTVRIVQRTIFEQHAKSFIHGEFDFEKSHVVNHTIDFDTRSINVVLLGQEIDSLTIAQAEQRMADYSLENTSLKVVQGSAGMTNSEVQLLVSNHANELNVNAELLTIAEEKSSEIQHQLDEYQNEENLARTILPELQVLYPDVQSLSISRGRTAYANDSLAGDSVAHIALVRMSQPVDKNNYQRMQDWLTRRTSLPSIYLVVEKKDNGR